MIDHYSTARTMAGAITSKEISARELLELHLDRIEVVNPTLNALVSVDGDRARAAAARADEQLARGEPVGPLHGVPVGIKDTHELAGWRTTFGSPLRQDYVPTRDELIVERIRTAGAVIVGHTNVPEWAAGSHTFNPVFGRTANPYDRERSAGGSSGGAAAALASGMLPLADGSDMGGSLRNPASYCNVVGLRPSPGRVPSWPTNNPWSTISVQGPLARNVADLALLLSVIAGPDSRSPIGLDTNGTEFDEPHPATLRDLKVAVSLDLGGAYQLDPEVAEQTATAAATLEALGADVREAHPDLGAADSVFRTLRAWLFDCTFSDMLADNPGAFKDSLRDNILEGRLLTGRDVGRAYEDMAQVYRNFSAFFTEFDVLLLPVSQVPPFEGSVEFPTQINGEAHETYLDWMRSCYLISVTGCPAISVPYGFTSGGLPIGVQLVTGQRDDLRLLQIARAFEGSTQAGNQHPAI